MKICIITDSASDIPQTQENVTVVPMSVRFGEDTFEDGVNLSHLEFYEKLVASDTLPTTSQASPYAFEQVIKENIDTYDAIIIVTISSKLSGTYQSATIAASEYEDKVFVVDTLSVTVGQRILVDYAIQLANEGKTAKEIVDILNVERENVTIVAMLDTLEYLKRGGRISSTTAFAGKLLSIKPAVTVIDGEVAMLGTARGSKQINNFLAKAINEKGVNFDRPIWIGYTGNDTKLLDRYIEDSKQFWEGHLDPLPIMTIGGAIGTHVGPGAIAVGFFNQNGK